MNACLAAPALEMPGLRLCSGLGDGKKCACWMGMITLATSDKFSDRPESVAETIRRFCIRLNDSIPDDSTRKRLIAPIWNLPINTAVQVDGVWREDPEHAKERAMIATRAVFHEILPLAYRVCGFEDQAKSIESVKLDGWADRPAAVFAARKVRDELYAIRDSRRAAAADAAADYAAYAAAAAADAAYAAAAAAAAAAAYAAAAAAARSARLAPAPVVGSAVGGVGGGVGNTSVREQVWEKAVACVRAMCAVGRAA
ncbi:MAG: hypothetical protein JSS51_10190 [Planctomycetes bacterium]|nr:hypothetical protein [Planctomycetota bacterium]